MISFISFVHFCMERSIIPDHETQIMDNIMDDSELVDMAHSFVSSKFDPAKHMNYTDRRDLYNAVEQLFYAGFYAHNRLEVLNAQKSLKLLPTTTEDISSRIIAELLLDDAIHLVESTNCMKGVKAYHSYLDLEEIEEFLNYSKWSASERSVAMASAFVGCFLVGAEKAAAAWIYTPLGGEPTVADLL